MNLDTGVEPRVPVYALNLPIHATLVSSSAESQAEPSVCKTCGMRYQDAKSLISHEASAHKKTAKTIRCQETGCGTHSKSINDLRIHLEKAHHLDLNGVDMELPNQKAFFRWKKQVELNNCVCFVKKKSKNLPFERQSFFYCNKSVVCATKNAKGVNCTAYLFAKENLKNGRVMVTGCLTHYGHSMTSRHFIEALSKRSRDIESEAAGQETDLTLLSNELLAIYELALTKKKQRSVDKIRAALKDLFECLKDYDEDDETLPGLEETQAWKRSEALEKAQQDEYRVKG